MKFITTLGRKHLRKTTAVFKFVVVALLFFLPQQSKGFALLGPFADWMQPTNGFFPAYDIGGPVNLGEEYRWNVPTLTYGFDQTFLEYFGSNGVVAVEQAFQILNALPPASSMDLNDYSTNLPRMYPQAEMQQLIDLKSVTLAMLLEQLGLTQPTRNVFVLRQWTPLFETLPSHFQWPESIIPANVLERNFDPELLTPSHFVNHSHFGGGAVWWPAVNPYLFDIDEYLIDPTQLWYSAVADHINISHGTFFICLSADDVGGLRYLIHTNNVNYEGLLPDVRGATNPVYVDAAMRQGVDKITFVKQEFNSLNQEWISVTNQFVDTYLTNSQPLQQTLERVIARPDFLFSVGDTGLGQSYSPNILRTGITNWQNHGTPAPGPGVIRPPIRFTFNRFPHRLSTYDYLGFFGLDDAPPVHWASFDGTTNSTIYPTESFQETNQFIVRFRMVPSTFEWSPNVERGDAVLLQTSTNLTDWTDVISVTNAGGVIEWHHQKSSSQAQRFFRVFAK